MIKAATFQIPASWLANNIAGGVLMRLKGSFFPSSGPGSNSSNPFCRKLLPCTLMVFNRQPQLLL
jgi:hypothetical protein